MLNRRSLSQDSHECAEIGGGGLTLNEQMQMIGHEHVRKRFKVARLAGVQNLQHQRGDDFIGNEELPPLNGSFADRSSVRAT